MPKRPLLQRVLPLHPDYPPATQVALAVSILLFVLVTVQTGEPMQPSSWSLFRAGANLGPWTLAGGEFWRVLTYASLHGGLIHLAFNGWVLFRQAPVLERAWGTWQFCLIYAVGAITGGLASAVFTPSVSIGASGALFAIFGGLLVVLHFNPHPIARAQRNQVLKWIVIMLVIGAFSGQIGVHIDNAAHVGGLLGGMAVTLGLRSLARVKVATRVLRPLAGLLFAALMIAPVARAFVARDLPVNRGATDAEVLSTLRSAWGPCRDAALSERPEDAVAPCERFREISFDRAMGYVFLGTLHAALGNEQAAARERRMFEGIAGEPHRDALAPPDVLLPLQARQIDEALRVSR